MKKKAFTLIELLAVIVLLAVIALISTPIIIKIIEETKKKSAIDSVHGIVEAARLYKAEKSLEEKEEEMILDLAGNELAYKGSRPKKGTLLINKKGDVYVLASYGEYCIEKQYTEDSPQIVSEEKCKSIEEPKIYGIRRSLNTVSSTWERLEASVGLEANAQVGNTPVKNDFDAIYPWSDIISYNYDTETKKITAYYGDENFKFDGTNGEVLTKIPEFYYKRSQDDEYEYIYISKIRRDGYEKSEEFSVGRYTMSGDSSHVHSRSGHVPLVNKTITNFREYAKALGEEFGQLDYHYFLLQMLYLVEYADYNSQKKLGQGYSGSQNTSAIQSGGCNTLGMKSGSKDGMDNSSVIYRGIEDIFGNVWQFVDGMNIKDDRTYICYDKSKYQVDTFDGCYKPVGFTNVNQVTGRHPSKLGYDAANPMVATPIEINGSSNDKNMCDHYFGSLTGNKIVLVGGYWSHTSNVGMFYWSFAEVSTLALDTAGARLLKSN